MEAEVGGGRRGGDGGAAYGAQLAALSAFCTEAGVLAGREHVRDTATARAEVFEEAALLELGLVAKVAWGEQSQTLQNLREKRGQGYGRRWSFRMPIEIGCGSPP